MQNPPAISKVFAHTVVFRNSSKVFTLLSGVILARVLGPEGRGHVALIIASITILGILSNLVNGANEVLLGEDNKRQSKLITQTIAWNFVITSLFATLLLFLPESVWHFVLGTDNQHFFLVFTVLFFTFTTQEGLRRLLLARQDFYFINTVAISGPICYLLLLGIFLWLLDYGVLTAVISFTAQQLLMVTAYLVRLISKLNVDNVSFGGLDKELLQKAAPIGTRAALIGIPTILLLRSDIWLLNSLSTSSNVGIYQVAVTLCMVVFGFSRILNTIVRAKAVSESGGHEAALLVAKVFFLFGLASFVLFLAFGEQIIGLLYGKEFVYSFAPALILWGAYVFWGFGNPLAGFVVGKRKYPFSVVLGMNIAFLLNIGLNFILIPRYGPQGAAWASFCAYFVMFLVYCTEFKRQNALSIAKYFYFDAKEISRLLRPFR